MITITVGPPIVVGVQLRADTGAAGHELGGGDVRAAGFAILAHRYPETCVDLRTGPDLDREQVLVRMRDLGAIEPVRPVRVVLVLGFGGVSDRPGNPTRPGMEAGSTTDRLPDHVLQGSYLFPGRQDINNDPEDLAVVS